MMKRPESSGLRTQHFLAGLDEKSVCLLARGLDRSACGLWVAPAAEAASDGRPVYAGIAPERHSGGAVIALLQHGGNLDAAAHRREVAGESFQFLFFSAGFLEHASGDVYIYHPALC